MRALGLLLVALVVVGCHFDSAVFHPDPKDYPCHDDKGEALVGYTSCRPYDGTPTCCPTNTVCGINQTCPDNGNPDTLGARKPVARVSEDGSAAP